MALWKKLWLLFAVIWVVVAMLNVFSILAFAEGEIDRAKVWYPLLFAVLVPATLYGVGVAWEWFTKKNK
jgi:hypothetical protein